MQHSPQDLHKKVLGRKGERLVEAYVKKQGCVIVQRNFRTPFGEADLIALDGDEVVFIEVKTRTSDRFGRPSDAVVKTKQQRYRKIAQWYGLQTGEEPNARFDVAEVFADGTIEYMKYAF